MLNLVAIMKTAVFTIAAIALLRSAIATLPHFSNNDNHNHDRDSAFAEAQAQAQLVYQVDGDHSSLSTSAKYIAQPVLSDTLPPHTHRLAHSHSRDPPPLPDPPSSGRPNDSYHAHHVGTSGPLWGIVYHPYNSDTTCKTRAQVSTDIDAISKKGFSSIRLHASDCSILPKIAPGVRKAGMKVILGVHVDEESGLREALPQIEEIVPWATTATATTGGWEMVEKTLFNAFFAPARPGRLHPCRDT